MKTKLILLVILALGLGLRVARLDSVGFMTSDEASYVRHARFISTVIKKSAGAEVDVVNPEASGIWKYVYKKDWNEKPCWLHTAFMVPGMLIDDESLALAALPNIIFSLLSVWMVFLIGRRLWGAGTGLTAAFILSVQHYWFIYSRGFWAEVDGVFFVLLAVWLLVREKHGTTGVTESTEGKKYIAQRRQGAKKETYSQTITKSTFMRLVSSWLGNQTFLAGMTAGLAVLCHYRLLYAVAPIGLSVCLLSTRKAWIKKWLLLASGFALTVGGAALVLRLIANAGGFSEDFTGLIGALLEEYLPDQAGAKQTGLQMGNLAAYGFYIARTTGIVFTLAAVAGMVFCCKQLRPAGAGLPQSQLPGMAELVPLIFVLFPLLVLCAQVWVVARGVTLALPFLALLAARGFNLLTTEEIRDKKSDGIEEKNQAHESTRINTNLCALASLREKKIFSFFLFLLLFGAGENIWRDAQYIRNDMGHGHVATFLQGQSADIVYCDSESAIIYSWYAPELNYRSLNKLTLDDDRINRIDGIKEKDPAHESTRINTNLCTFASLRDNSRSSFAVFDSQKYHMYRASTERVTAMEKEYAENMELITAYPNLTTGWKQFLYDGTQSHSLRDMFNSIDNAGHDIRTIRVYRITAHESPQIFTD